MTWTYGDNLRKIRERAGMTQDEAARRIGVRERAWGSWERGTHDPREENLKRIVETFQVPPATIGYEPPEGWELVPARWIADATTSIDAKLDAILDELQRRRPA